MKKGTVTKAVTRSLNVRNASGAIVAALKYDSVLDKGDVVFGEVKTDNRIYFNEIHRANGALHNLASVCSAIISEGTTKYIDLVDVNEPAPEPPPTSPPPPTAVKPLTVVITGDDYKAVTVTLEPKE